MSESYFCYLCSTSLTEEKISYEHIIPEALGNSLKSPRLLCRTCNNNTGNAIDSALVQEMRHLEEVLNIYFSKSDKPVGVRLSNTNFGEDLFVQKGKTYLIKPQIKVTLDDNILEVKAQFTNWQQMKAFVKSLKKKHPEIDENEIISKAKVCTFENPKGIYKRLPFSNDALRAVVKILTNFYLLNKGDQADLEEVISYIKTGDESSRVAQSILTDIWEHTYSPAADEFSHIIRIIGDPKTRTLLGYIDLFNVYDFWVVIDDDYQGSFIDIGTVLNLFDKRHYSKELKYRTIPATSDPLLTKQQIRLKELKNRLLLNTDSD